MIGFVPFEQHDGFEVSAGAACAHHVGGLLGYGAILVHFRRVHGPVPAPHVALALDVALLNFGCFWGFMSLGFHDGNEVSLGFVVAFDAFCWK